MINSFLLIGQSNMAGRGKLTEINRLNNPDVFLFKDNAWVIAEEPYHHDLPTAGAGLAASFGDVLSQKYEKRIGFIPCAFGGTKISQWQPGEQYYENAINTTLEAQKTSVLKGILWHQGENDTSVTRKLTYDESFRTFLTSLLCDLNVDGIPVIIGELGAFLELRGTCYYWKEINEALHDIAEQNNEIELVLSTGLQDGGDHLHFNSPSLREFGKRYANAWERVSSRLGIHLE